MNKLIAAAKTEGSVTFATYLAGPIIQALQSAWAAKYPTITLTIDRTTAATQQTIVTQQEAAHQVSTDVFDGGTDLLLFRQLGELQPFYSAEESSLPSYFYYKAPHALVWGEGAASDFVDFAYNTNLLPASEVPKTIEDLANPDLKGKLTLQANSSTAYNWIGLVEYALGAKRANAFFAKMKNQGVIPWGSSSQALAASIAAGTSVAGPAIYDDHAFEYEMAGAPMKWVDLTPSYVGQYIWGVPVGAPHPAAALLLIDWLNSRQTQAVFASQLYDTANFKLPKQFANQQKGLKPYSVSYKCPTPYDETICLTDEASVYTSTFG